MATRNSTINSPQHTAHSQPGGSLTSLPAGGLPAPLPVNNGPAVKSKVGGKLIRFDTFRSQFKTLVLIIAAICAAALVGTSVMLINTGERFQQIIKNSAPSVNSALQMGRLIEEADNQAATYQLILRLEPTSTAGIIATTPQKVQDALQEKLTQFSDQLYQARVNVNYKEQGEEQAVKTISVRFLEYVGLINTMQYEMNQGHKEAALAVYKSAHDLLIGNIGNAPLTNGQTSEEILKLNSWSNLKPEPSNCKVTTSFMGIEANIAKISAINTCELKKAQSDANGAQLRNRAFAVAESAVLVAVLGYLITRFALVTHRLINPGYFLSLVLASLITVPLIIFLFQAQKDYDVVARDSFDSVIAAETARQYLADANADVVRYLLSPESSGLDLTSPALTSGVRAEFNQVNLSEEFNKKYAIVQQQIGNAWSKVSYPAEIADICLIEPDPGNLYNCRNTSFALVNLKNETDSIRTKYKNAPVEGIKVVTGTSNVTLSTIDNAMSNLTGINQKEFDKASCNAIGQTEFATVTKVTCSNPGYVPLLQAGTIILFPLVALAAMGGYMATRQDF